MRLFSSGRSEAIVLDTNVVSGFMRTDPDPDVRAWAEMIPAGRLLTTAVTVAEIRLGINRLPDGRRRYDLQAAAEEIFQALPDRILGFDLDAAAAYADIAADRLRTGHQISGFDAQIAAICRARGVALATRNTRDFNDLGLSLIDPWQAEHSR